MHCNVAIRMLRNISLSSIETFEASLCDIVHHCLTTPASSSHSAQLILSSLVLVSDTSAAAARDIALLCRTYLSYYCYAVIVHSRVLAILPLSPQSVSDISPLLLPEISILLHHMSDRQCVA